MNNQCSVQSDKTSEYLDIIEQRKHSNPIIHPSIVEAQAQALTLLKDKGLPRYKSENYQRFDIDKVLRINTETTFDQSELVLKASATKSQPYLFGSFSEVVKSIPEHLQSLFYSAPSIQKGALSALNLLFLDEVSLLYIPDSTTITEPIELSQVIDSHKHGHLFNRLIVIADEQSRAELVLSDKIQSEDAVMQFVVEMYLQPSATIRLADVEDSVSTSKVLKSFHVVLRESAKLSILSVPLHTGLVRNNYSISLNGEYAEVDLNGFGLLTDQQKLDNFTEISHLKPHCTSNQLFKYVILDQAYGIFSGLIYVAKDAQKTQAYQNNRNLILSPKGKMYSKPQLEIYADDVKCSHGMTTGELDPKAMFYMQQRGIPEREAKLLLTLAFLDEIVTLVPEEEIRKELYDSLWQRLESLTK